MSRYSKVRNVCNVQYATFPDWLHPPLRARQESLLGFPQRGPHWSSRVDTPRRLSRRGRIHPLLCNIDRTAGVPHLGSQNQLPAHSFHSRDRDSVVSTVECSQWRVRRPCLNHYPVYVRDCRGKTKQDSRLTVHHTP